VPEQCTPGPLHSEAGTHVAAPLPPQEPRPRRDHRPQRVFRPGSPPLLQEAAQGPLPSPRRSPQQSQEFQWQLRCPGGARAKAAACPSSRRNPRRQPQQRLCRWEHALGVHKRRGLQAQSEEPLRPQLLLDGGPLPPAAHCRTGTKRHSRRTPLSPGQCWGGLAGDRQGARGQAAM